VAGIVGLGLLYMLVPRLPLHALAFDNGLEPPPEPRALVLVACVVAALTVIARVVVAKRRASSHQP